MSGSRVYATVLGVAMTAACGAPAPRLAPTPARDLIVLAPHPEGGALGEATVRTGGPAVSLTRAGEAVEVRAGQPPSAPVILGPDDIQRLFGDALAAMPPPARRFLLYFELGADTLTPEAQTLVAEILATVKARGRPDVGIVGHTDTTGAADANVALGLRRAALVRDLVVAAGLDASLIDVTSHGESNLVEPTPDNTESARNRRVEVTVR